MNKKLMTVMIAGALACATGCATAGTWVNGCYIDGPLCTVCDGLKVVTHAYGTAVCTHCDGTGIEPPPETVIVENVIVDTWCPPPPPRFHHRPILHRNPPRGHGGPRHTVRVGGHGQPPRNFRSPPRRPGRPAGGGPARPNPPRGGGHGRRGR